MPQFSSVQSFSHIQLFATPWTAACQASLSITNSQSLLKLMSIELVMPHPLCNCSSPMMVSSSTPSMQGNLLTTLETPFNPQNNHYLQVKTLRNREVK